MREPRSEENDALTRLLAERSALHRPAVRPIAAPAKTWVPVAFPSTVGAAGDKKTVRWQGFYTFKGGEFFAADSGSQGGRGTRIAMIRVGNIPVVEGPIPTWLFSEHATPEERAVWEDAAQYVGTSDETALHRQMAASLRLIRAAEKMTWPTVSAGLPIEIDVIFDEACRFDAALWGWRLR